MYRNKLLLLCVLVINTAVQAQVFRSTAPPPPPPDPTATTPPNEPTWPLISLDTNFISWSEEQLRLLAPQEHIVQQLDFPGRSFGRFYLTEDRLALALVKSLYEEGRQVGSELHFNLLDTTGLIVDSLILPHDKGITIVDLCEADGFFYLAYQKSINSGNRYMHIAKVDQTAQLIWETKLGQRFGTRGLRLLRPAPDGNIVLLSQMYDQVGFDIISTAGNFVERKLLHFYQEFSPKSFFFKPNGQVVGIGTYTEYEGPNVKTSSVVFELDRSFQLLHYQQVQSPFNDIAQDVTMDEQGNYYYFTNAENTRAPYGQRTNFMTIGKLDADFNPIASTNIKNTDTGLSLGLSYHPNKGLFAYQRFWNKGNSFTLFQLDTDLELQEIVSAKGRFGTPLQLLLQDDQFLLMFDSRGSKVITFSLGK